MDILRVITTVARKAGSNSLGKRKAGSNSLGKRKAGSNSLLKREAGSNRDSLRLKRRINANSIE
jgi:hypothetical protein